MHKLLKLPARCHIVSSGPVTSPTRFSLGSIQTTVYTKVVIYLKMEDNVDINKIPENIDDSEEFEFKYNFINTPWDDRSNKSKAGIVSLLVAIFIATMGCVANSFVMHYRGFRTNQNTNHSEMNCFRVKMEEYLYVARIHSLSSKELLCVGAVVSPTSILANGVCAKAGPIRVHIGSPTE